MSHIDNAIEIWYYLLLAQIILIGRKIKMCLGKKKQTSTAEEKKTLQCVVCGQKLEDTSLDSQMKHQAATGHRLYTEILER